MAISSKYVSGIYWANLNDGWTVVELDIDAGLVFELGKGQPVKLEKLQGVAFSGPLQSPRMEFVVGQSPGITDTDLKK